VPFDAVSYALAKKALRLAIPVERINVTITRLSETYTAGEEKTQLSLTGRHGYATLVHIGDGDAGVTTRIYLDGSLFESVPANVYAFIFVTFSSSLEIRGYAPSAGTFYRSASYVGGLGRSV